MNNFRDISLGFLNHIGFSLAMEVSSIGNNSLINSDSKKSNINKIKTVLNFFYLDSTPYPDCVYR